MALGPGYFDDEGIYHHGEDDENPLTSDLWGRLSDSVRDQFELVRADISDLQDPPDTGWRDVLASTTPTVPDGYSKFVAPWIPTSSARFYSLSIRVRDGHVYVTGAAQSTTVVGVQSTIFILPPGMWPSRPMVAWATYGSTSQWVYVTTDGEVKLEAATSVGNTIIFTLQFPAALS